MGWVSFSGKGHASLDLRGNFNDLFFFNLSVAHTRVFSASTVFSGDAQVYVACVQMAERSVWFPALCRWKAACTLCPDRKPFHPACRSCCAHCCITLSPRHLY